MPVFVHVCMEQLHETHGDSFELSKHEGVHVDRKTSEYPRELRNVLCLAGDQAASKPGVILVTQVACTMKS